MSTTQREAPGLTLTVQADGPRSLIALDGEADHHSSEQVLRLANAALATGASSVVFDCTALTFMDSGFLDVLAQLAPHTKHGERLEVRSAPEHMRRLFAIAGFEHLVDLT